MNKTASQIADEVLVKCAAEEAPPYARNAAIGSGIGGLIGGIGGSRGGTAAEVAAVQAAIRKAIAASTHEVPFMDSNILNAGRDATIKYRALRTLKGLGGGAALGLGVGLGGTALHRYLNREKSDE